ncbi:MAG: THUMP domain-containing protein, partial [Pseudomonadota bacterium]
MAVYAGSGLFLAATPGLEDVVAAEARAQGFRGARVVAGGVEVEGGWAEARRANLWLRTPGRVLVRLAAFRALHLAQLNKRARRIDWAGLFPPGAGVVVEAACRASRIYHQGAAAARVRAAITYGAGAVEGGEDPLRVMVRIDDDLCVISLDSSGAPLHRRGAKQAVVKAPLRETLAAAFLRLA